MERAHEAFVYVGLWKRASGPVGTYSLDETTGELAQAIAHGPKVLIWTSQRMAWPASAQRLIELIRESGKPVIFACCSPRIFCCVEETCDEVRDSAEWKIASICDLVEETAR